MNEHNTAPGPHKSRRSALIIALDIGTSSTRALLYDAQGRLQTGGEQQIPYSQTATADGGVSTDPDSLYRLTLSALTKLLRSLDSSVSHRVAGIAISCFWHSLMGIDSEGAAITPLYSWADTRASRDASEMAARWDQKAYHARTGAFIHSSYWPAKLMWLSRTDPSTFGRVHQWISFADYLSLRLFGDTRTSVSMAASTGLYDPNRNDWDAETLRDLPIDRKRLPDIAREGYYAELAPKSPRELHVLAGVPWQPAYGDGAASNVGAGGVDDSSIVVNVGTSGAIRILASMPEFAIRPKLFAYRADRARFVVGGAMSNGGNIYAWLRQNLQADSDMMSRVASTRRKRPDGHGLTVLPFLAGERSPGWRSDAHGLVSGLNLHSTSQDIVLAMMEALVYPFFEVWTDLRQAFPKAKSVTLSGGAFKHSSLLGEIFADVFGIELKVCAESEPSGRGASLLLSELLGLSSLAKSHHPTVKTMRPDARRHAIYSEAMARYHDLYRHTLTQSSSRPRPSATPP